MTNPAEQSLFMMCRTLDRSAVREMPSGFHMRLCRTDELEQWMTMPFDTPQEARAYRAFMQEYFDRVYAPRADEFFRRCQFVCDDRGRPVATAFVWTILDDVTTFHWLKVRRELEGRGIGRALISSVMAPLRREDYPVFLHTHPACYRAVKLYSDMGFELLSDPQIGTRTNDVDSCLSHLRAVMPTADFARLKVARAPSSFLERLTREIEPEF